MWRDDLSESDAPVPTGQRNLIGRIIFFYTIFEYLNHLVDQFSTRYVFYQIGQLCLL